MIGTLLRISWLNLKRDRVALGLTFVLPLIFFSIFAVIFGGMGNSGGGSESIKIVGVDEDLTEVSAKFLDALDGHEAIEIVTAPQPSQDDPHPEPFTRESALTAVRTGKRSGAIVIPRGFGDNFGSFGDTTSAVELIHDPSNPLIEGIVTGLIQASAMSAAPDILLEGGVEQLELYGGALTPEQDEAIGTFKQMLSQDGASPQSGDEAGEGEQDATSAGSFSGLVVVQTTNPMEGEQQDGDGPSIVSY